jgi:fluoride ion exporter CrcB/FEX
MIVFAITVLAGGLGAAARFALDTALTRRLTEGWLRLMAINISGSALLGLLGSLGSSLGMLLRSAAGAALGAVRRLGPLAWAP